MVIRFALHLARVVLVSQQIIPEKFEAPLNIWRKLKSHGISLLVAGEFLGDRDFRDQDTDLPYLLLKLS